MERAGKKKILYVITKSNWGGAQRYVFDLATVMKVDGYDVAVALGGSGLLKTKLDSAGIRTISINSLRRDMSVTGDTASLRQIYSIIKTEWPDVLHLNSPKAAGLGAFSGRLLGVKNIIQTVHGWTFNEDRPLFQRAAIRFFSWLTTLLCHRTIVLSEREFTQGQKFPFIKNKLTLIPLGVHPPMFLSREEARKRLGLLPNALVAGSIGELTGNKNYAALVAATARLSEKHTFMLALIGDGEQKNALAEQIQKTGLSACVLQYGFKPEATQYLKAFDIFVLPSLKEGLPYVLLEAGLASVPVVATNVGGVPTIIEDKKTGLLVPPKNSAELARAISYLIEHPTERTAFGAALYTHVAQKFSFEKMLTETAQIYLAKEKEPADEQHSS